MVAIILGNGFEDIEALAPCDVLRRGGLDVRLAGVNGPEITSGRGVTVHADCALGELVPETLELLVIPGGNGGVASILESEEALAFISRAAAAGVPLGAICAGPKVLSRLGLIKGRNAVCHPTAAAEVKDAVLCPAESVVRDGDLITGRAAGSSLDFGFALLRLLRGDEAVKTVAEGMCWHG